MQILPKARTENIVVREAGKEVIVRDLNADKGYQLNEISTIVYRACDGHTTFGALKERTKLSDHAISRALEGFRKENLLCAAKPLSRRELISRLTFSSALLMFTGLIAGCEHDMQGLIPGSGSSDIGAPGYVIVTYISSKGGADNPTNTAGCTSSASTICKSKTARLVCTGPFTNSCACTCN